MKRSHIFDPEHISVLEAEDRKAWQNPNEILSAVKLRPEFVAADLGCGSGYFTVPLARKVKKVYGIDVQRQMLDFLEGKIRKRGIRNIDALLSKPDEIPLGAESVDFLMSVNTLHEFGDRNKMFSEMRRVLRKCGELLIVDFKKEETGFGPPVSIRISKTRVIRLLEAKGFRLRRVKELPYHYLLVFIKN